jgi:parvulin-like peptidyl-prolyl isomerase
MLRRLLRAPAVHFLVIGGLIFAAGRWRDVQARGGVATAPPPEILLTAADVEGLRRGWAQQHGRAPGPEVDRALVEEAIDEEILYREARALGLDRDDRVVRERLLRLARFLSDEPARDDETLVREARALGLDERDLVIRRYLVQRMRLVASLPEAPDRPDEAELASYLARHAERFRQPPEVRLTHVYLARDRRRAATETDAAHLLARLRRDGAAPAAAAALGDPFLHGHALAPQSPAGLERIFGPGFADAVAGVPVGSWAGPIASTYGLHLVWVHERTAARLPPLDAVRSQVVQGLLKERREERLRTRLAVLRRRYVIRVPLPAPHPPEDGGA